MRDFIIKSAAIFIIILLVLSLLSALINPFFINLSVFGLFYPYILLPALLLLPFLYRGHKISFLTLGFASIWGLSHLFAYISPNLGAWENVSGDKEFTVMSFNAMMGMRLVNNKRVITSDKKRDFENLMNTLPVPDIICAQEVNSIVNNLLSASFDYPYKHRIKNRRTIILSKFPIVNSGQVDFGQKINSCLWADIAVSGDTLRIYSTHLESNRVDEESYEFLSEEEYKNTRAIRGIKDIFTKYIKYSLVRISQAREIKNHAAASNYPVIICGDFNEAPISYTYKILKEDMIDTFMESGRGLGSSWNGGIPLLRIDYILADKRLKNTRFYTLNSDLSDHYPVKAVFDLK